MLSILELFVGDFMFRRSTLPLSCSAADPFRRHPSRQDVSVHDHEWRSSPGACDVSFLGRQCDVDPIADTKQLRRRLSAAIVPCGGV